MKNLKLNKIWKNVEVVESMQVIIPQFEPNGYLLASFVNSADVEAYLFHLPGNFSKFICIS